MKRFPMPHSSTGRPRRRLALAAAPALALVLLAGSHGTGLSRARAQDADSAQPDLTIGISGPQYGSGYPQTPYRLTIRNPTLRFWDPDRRQTVSVGAPATGITVRSVFTIHPNAYASDGLVIASVSGTHDFACSASGREVSCSGGRLASAEAATITVLVSGPPGLQFTQSATVDPQNAIAERSEANNTASFAACLCQELLS
jgi:hypothetical protein